MEDTQRETLQIDDPIYGLAANLLINEKKSSSEVKQVLVNEGVDEESATIVVDNLELQIKEVKKEQANKDMLYGALWCVGGIVMTAADIGFIFWGAIVFGGYQFFRGLLSS
jgi:hypothetical protein